MRRWILVAMLLALPIGAAAAQQTPGAPADPEALEAAPTKKHPIEVDTDAEIRHTLFRLPLAAALGAALAFRPRRRGTPTRQPAVIQTQIILAIVGSLVMLVVGTNLARAFGVVGAAGLVRYRARIEDPKDAGVMLSTLGIGLSCGVGLYLLAVLSTGVILIVLWVIESFEPQTRRLYDLVIKMGGDTDTRRKQFDAILSRYHVDFDLRSSSDESISYEVGCPLDMNREDVTNTILRLDPEGHGSVDWSEKKAKAK
jgi:uncharacterized membrane protein YhiD involved in acid resistance